MQPTTSGQSIAAPISQSERILVIDSLRGIAILGILLMNIPGFGLAPTAISDFSVQPQGKLNYYFWYVFGPGVFEGTQRAIFSMLFGAGMYIFTTRLEKRVSGMLSAELFIRRQLWLLVFGVFHAYILLWYWDVLYHYAICGIIVFAFRRMSPKKLFIAAGVALLMMTVVENKNLYRDKNTIRKGEIVAAIDTTTTKLTDKQTEQLAAYEGMKKRSEPEEKKKRMKKQEEAITGSYAELYKERSKMAEEGETYGMYYWAIWDVTLFMFLGLAFFKLKILQGEAKTKVYAWMAVIGLGIGLPLSYMFVRNDVNYNFNHFEIVRNKAFEFYEIQRFVHSIGLFGLIMLLYKSGWFKWLFKLLRPVGQMAFTNYLTQSIMCGIFFYGIGFGYFGKLEYHQLFYVVGTVWIIQIIWSNIWLKYFRFGPMEWVWRSLTYWQKQPMRRPKKEEPPSA
ncbi:MAG TPA: DUF418 domain-containing protein [Chitinophagaceae bacterium]|nr:DUF418 domain-containing protein [Chitinophagaceae bacterium]MCB9054914.1 DUF418 domain-containing protein [Chitinophagales bacterium]HRX93969.1 DUF418 domain-containing protein [Chitinophagaceae bacterium]